MCNCCKTKSIAVYGFPTIGAIFTEKCPPTVECNDGTYSTSLGPGACRGHGGRKDRKQRARRAPEKSNTFSSIDQLAPAGPARRSYYRWEQSGQSWKLISPFNSDIISKAKQLGAKWDGAVWVFSDLAKMEMQNTLNELFGIQGEPAYTVRFIAVKRNPEWLRNPTMAPFVSRTKDQRMYLAGGRIIAEARVNNSDAKPGPGVLIVEGGLRSSGSQKNWDLELLEGQVVVIMEDVPASWLRHWLKVAPDWVIAVTPNPRA